MARGRTKLVIDGRDLQAVVDELESKNTFSTRAELWAAIEASEWAKSLEPRPLTAQVAMMRAKELNVTIKTAKGKKGREKGEAVPRGERKRKRIPLEMVQPLKDIFPESVHQRIDSAAQGSLKAAVALKCLDCCGYQKKEVALCCTTMCTLWAFRPWQRAMTKTAEGRAKILSGEWRDPSDKSDDD